MSWHLRRGTSVLDVGGQHQPIALHFPKQPGSKRRLQAMISRWHHDDRGLCALQRAPDFLCLQIVRFHANGRRHDRVTWEDPVLQVPVFVGVSGQEVIWHRYRICCGIVHIGSTPQSGHYQAFSVDIDNRLALWDDNTPLRACQDSEMLERRICFLWLLGVGNSRGPLSIAGAESFSSL